MSDYEIPKPEPKEIDSVKWLEWKDVMERATLKGHPYNDERCDNCLYYLDPDEEQAMVGRFPWVDPTAPAGQREDRRE